jgi:hypothetical protein
LSEQKQSSAAVARVQINGTARVAQFRHMPISTSVLIKFASVEEGPSPREALRALVTLIAPPSLLVRSASAVERVVRIDRVSVNANITAITAQFDLPFRRVVARLTQRLQFPGDEVGPVASVRRDVIDDVRPRHDSALQTELAQQMLRQLQLA